MKHAATVNKSQDLEDIWHGIRNRDRNSLAKLYHRTHSWLLKYGYGITPDTNVVEDSVQELFFILGNKGSSLSHAHSVKSYLFSSLRRIILRSLKRQQSRKERNRMYKTNEFDVDFNTEDLATRGEDDERRRKALHKALQYISERQRQAILLKYMKGFSSVEISSIMEINKQSVYNHISKGIREMRSYVHY